MFAGLIAANLPDASEVLTATGDFTSIPFPFYAQSGRGIRVREEMAALPRGTAYFTINPALIDDLTPHHAGWYAGDDPWPSIYGGPLRLASDARRFDVSPAWHGWVAAAPAVRLLAQVGTQSLTGTPLAWRTGSAPE